MDNQQPSFYKILDNTKLIWYNIEKGPTTIPQGSTHTSDWCVEVVHTLMGEDIVCALLKNRGSKDQQGVAPIFAKEDQHGKESWNLLH